jgi:hypothetical protein
MKPRPLPALWTVEDFDVVWLKHIAGRNPFAWHTWQLSYMEADRRDADLMLEAREAGAVSVTIMRSPHGRHEVSVWWEFGKMRGWKS